MYRNALSANVVREGEFWSEYCGLGESVSLFSSFLIHSKPCERCRSVDFGSLELFPLGASRCEHFLNTGIRVESTLRYCYHIARKPRGRLHTHLEGLLAYHT